MGKCILGRISRNLRYKASSSNYLRVDGSRIGKEKVANSKMSGYVWTEAESTKKKLRIQKCSDTCGRKPNPQRKSCEFKNVRIRVDGSRIHKEKVANSKMFGYVWTEAESTKKKLRIQKCSDTCGQKPNPQRKSCEFKNVRIRVDGA